MVKIVFASNNLGKTNELRALLKNHSIEILTLTDVSVPEVEESASTFVENALLKARHAAKITGLPAIADDSGLEVFALNGKPGIHSARYAGQKAGASENMTKLLRELHSFPREKRSARFYCALTFLLHAEDPTPLICEGSWQGLILEKPQGHQGFGYDPLFYVPSEKCSAAELSLEKKNLLSHRGQALRLFIEKLPGKL